MINVVVSGCNGAMGRVLTKAIEEMEDITIVAGIDKNINSYKNTYPVYKSPLLVKEECDVIIDFSKPSNLSGLLEYSVNNNIALVIATTGFSEEEENKIKEASKFTRIFKSSNMSVGVNVLINLSKQATNTLGNIADIEIIEKHHNKKVDSPSGTAQMLADSINTALGNNLHCEYNRHDKHEARSKNEIGMSSIRGGNIVGEHTVQFIGNFETFEIKHTSFSRNVFAEGALKAAEFIVQQQQPGLYSMEDM